MVLENDWEDRVYHLVECIPKGKVATYGQLARMLGHPRRARHVGYALARTPENRQIPWQRVINAQGRISFPPETPRYHYQYQLLKNEGIEFGKSGRINLRHFGWRP